MARGCGTRQNSESDTSKRIGHLYPKAKLADGGSANVIAWTWARTVTCPNPACGAEIPLASTWLSKTKATPTWIQPVVTGKRVDFEIKTDKSGPPDAPKRGRGAKFTCVICSDTTTDAYVKTEAMAGRMGVRLHAVVAEGNRRRVYLPASETQIEAAAVARPADVPEEPLANDPRNIWCVNYGLTQFGDLFTNRQLVTLTLFSGLVRQDT
jgi:putative DNA methylase